MMSDRISAMHRDREIEQFRRQFGPQTPQHQVGSGPNDGGSNGQISVGSEMEKLRLKIKIAEREMDSDLHSRSPVNNRLDSRLNNRIDDFSNRISGHWNHQGTLPERSVSDNDGLRDISLLSASNQRDPANFQVVALQREKARSSQLMEELEQEICKLTRNESANTPKCGEIIQKPARHHYPGEDANGWATTDDRYETINERERYSI